MPNKTKEFFGRKNVKNALHKKVVLDLYCKSLLQDLKAFNPKSKYQLVFHSGKIDKM